MDTTILLVDDHPIVRSGVRRLLDQESGLAVRWEAGTAAEALAVFERHTPDLAIVDVGLSGADGVQLVKQISSRWPEVFLLMLSMHTELLFAERSIRAGAHGYVMKQESPDRLVEAVWRVLEGGVYVSPELQDRWLQAMRSGAPTVMDPIERLSDRELSVFRLIGMGRSTREIAQALHISAKTVETHREHIKEKLELESAIQLLQRATLWLHAESDGR